MSSILVLAAVFLAPLFLLLLFRRACTLLSLEIGSYPDYKSSFWTNRKIVVALAAALLVSGYLYLLFSLAVTFLRYGLPPCESDEVVFWSRLACSAGLFVGSALLFLSRMSAGFRFAFAVAVPTLLFGLQNLVINHNMQRQAVCAARSLSEAMTVCGAEPTHFRRSITSQGFATLTLVAPGTTDRAWRCITDWTYHAYAAPSLEIDKSVYTAARLQAKPAACR